VSASFNAAMRSADIRQLEKWVFGWERMMSELKPCDEWCRPLMQKARSAGMRELERRHALGVTQ